MLARPPAAEASTSPELVKALVEASWAMELSKPKPCAASGETEIVKRQSARHRTLREAAVHLGRTSDVKVADRRWAAEKVSWDRKTARLDMVMPCAAKRLVAANDELERVLRGFGP
jgi:hypothetical protein